jgi:hypothetical protein
MKYVIHKASRLAKDISYNGVTWDQAGIRHLRCDTYDKLSYAKGLATILSKFNSIGFTVTELGTK